jgi:polar amino acid transport system substrate-binding protein
MRATRTHVALLAAALAALPAATARATPQTARAGDMVFCSDISYPPAEFFKGASPVGRELRRTAVGGDIDIAKQVAKRLSRGAVFVNTPFARIITALRANKCDAVISFMNDTPVRRQLVAFADYLQAGQSLMVAKGNPKHLSTAADLSGHAVSVEPGTTEEAFLRVQNTHLAAQAKPTIRIVNYPTSATSSYALLKGKVDAYFGDAPVVQYYVARNSGSFAVAGQLVGPKPIGIALRLGDPRLARVRAAIAAMYADGSMQRILQRWKLTAFALK